MNRSLRSLFADSFALLLTASLALAQNDLPQPVATARRAYTQTDETDNNILAQMPRRMGPVGRQGPPMRSAGYPGTWGPQFSPGHALIGAAIGFGFGAAAGSKNGVRSSFAVGTLVGLLGATIGAGIPSFPSHYRYRRGWDDHEEASRRKPKPAKPDSTEPEPATQVSASRQEAAETYQKNDFSGR
jgi:hypothetical protein